ncbi:unnamed protein product [Caenorhabditis auriculariae]|uniref:Uncharacterized protein n=1 Tax=Caenorhabditis auriculariae TaxID=2777116 RepID=A0A8S1HXS9_9PELO|nr:unnamed protein product [Caenorhabditis auriculariae]
MSNYKILAIIAIVLVTLVSVEAQLFGGWSQPSWGYSASGVGVDSFGNTFQGTPDNGIYLFCNGHGCPGRGRK